MVPWAVTSHLPSAFCAACRARTAPGAQAIVAVLAVDDRGDPAEFEPPKGALATLV